MEEGLRAFAKPTNLSVAATTEQSYGGERLI